jgi:cytoskeletal protein RodZ
MLERLKPILKVFCLGMSALVLWQLARLARPPQPLENLTLSAASFASAVPKTTAPDKAETNSAPRSVSATNDTNALTTPAAGSKLSSAAAARRQPAGSQIADLPTVVQTRIERITQSEILGAVVRPLPMALLGIAGRDAFVRTANGQTGLLREGEELDGIKLLRIGTNRVLIEHEQQQKELTLFSGFGSETLLPKGKADPK